MSVEKLLSKTNLQLLLSVVIAVVGLALLIVALVMPPRGQIDASVLVAFGEMLTFVGAIFGIDYVHRIKHQERH